jgi:hypothetical protein
MPAESSDGSLAVGTGWKVSHFSSYHMTPTAPGFQFLDEGQDLVGGGQGGRSSASQVQDKWSIPNGLPTEFARLEAGGLQEGLDPGGKMFAKCSCHRVHKSDMQVRRQLKEIGNFQYLAIKELSS